MILIRKLYKARGSEKKRGACITIGYVFINTIAEKEHEVYNLLSNESKIIELNPIFQDNNFDLLAKIKMRNHKKLKYYVFKKIQSLDGVIDTEIFC